MRAEEIIRKKRNGDALIKHEIKFLISGAVDRSIPDYQISAFLMAVYFKGMDSTEIAHLTSAIIESGITVSLNPTHAPYVDKHSTGGVGDGTSLIIAPILAACGLHVPMISGRALGHTGGTLDKLDSIPNYRTQLTLNQFTETVEKYGYAMCGQTADIAPADKQLYALRDVTATVESIPLITSSILSKKIAEGAETLVFDVKCGRGAFARDITFARSLATQLIETGNHLGKKVRAVITSMDQPLGVMIGNFLEIEQAAAALGLHNDSIYRDTCMADYLEVAKYLCVQILLAAGTCQNVDEAAELVDGVISDKSAQRRFSDNIIAQGGDVAQLQKMYQTRRAAYSRVISPSAAGYVGNLDAYTFGVAATMLGVGRETLDSEIDYEAGIQLCKKYGEQISLDEPLCILYTNTQSLLDNAELLLRRDGIRIDAHPPPQRAELILEVIGQ